MSQPADRVWEVVQLVRDRGGDLRDIINGCKERGLPLDAREVAALVPRLGRGAGEHFIPPAVADFVAKLVEPHHPAAVLDSWAGIGLLAIPVRERLRPERFEAISPNDHACQVLRALDPAGDIVVRCEDPLDSLGSSETTYDAVIANLPFGLRRDRPLTVEVIGETRRVSDDYGSLLVLQSCLRLAENGIGVFIVTNAFFASAQGKSRGTLEELGFRVTAAVELSAGTFHPITTLPTQLIMVRRSTGLKLFTAKFSPDERHQAELLKNLLARSQGQWASLGRLVDSESYRGFSSLDLAERVEEQARRIGLVPYEFAEVVTELNSPPSASDFRGFPERPNAVYLPQMAATAATTSQDALPERLKSYFQLIVDPAVADPDFLAGILNTPFGQVWRDSLRTGATIPRIGRATLEGARVYLPPRDKRALQTQVIECQHAVARLRNKLGEIEASVWTRPSSVQSAQNALRGLNREDQVTDWLDTLPFPLASILWACHTQSGSFREKYERKIQFFEALAEFLAVVHLSAFTTNESVWPPLKEKLKATLATQNLSFERATFGTWKTVFEILAGEARKVLNDDAEMCYELFRTRNRPLLEAVTSKQLVTLVQTANKLRNDWVGHTGAVRESDARAVDAELSGHIEAVRGAFGLVWEGYELLLPGACTVRDGVYRYRVRKAMGTRSPFPGDDAELVEPMDDGFLHLKDPGEKRTLKLLPLVKVMPSPRTEENACYFYNRRQRDGIRFLSYHFVSDAEVVDEFADAADALTLVLT